MTARYFTNPSNRYYEKTDNWLFLWYLLFGSFYLLYKGAWVWAVITLIAAACTYGISHFFFVFIARWMVENNYQKKGWINGV